MMNIIKTYERLSFQREKKPRAKQIITNEYLHRVTLLSGEESTEENAEAEFTKPADPEQRMANPRAKKMQKISRQGREKWAEYKRNRSGKLALEETTKASKLENDESITVRT